ncbi:MAG: PilZ domain-containing protein [Candidatus Omnitrophota bacterium]
MNKRKFLRFLTPLKVKAGSDDKEMQLGVIKDFSRDGLRAVFDNFEFEPYSSVALRIQSPSAEGFNRATAEVRWKKLAEGGCEVGLKLTDFLPSLKAEILDYGYDKWLEDTVYAVQD